MKKNWFIGFILLLPSLLRADVIEANSIEDFYPHVEEGTVVLLGMTDTIADSSLSLGSKPWRQYIRRQLRSIQDLNEAGNLHDQWTYFVAQQVPIKLVQKEFVEWIDKLQQQETPVYCLTGRGRDVWYSSIVTGVDELTEQQLKFIGVDFEKSKVPEELKKADPKFFHHGIFYSDPYDKGEFIDKILQETGYRPKKIVIVDDKWAQLKSVEEKLVEAGIPHVCILYQRAEKERKGFKPLIATLQLQSLFENGYALSEEEAVKRAEELENPLVREEAVEKRENPPAEGEPAKKEENLENPSVQGEAVEKTEQLENPPAEGESAEKAENPPVKKEVVEKAEKLEKLSADELFQKLITKYGNLN
jgi:hypothetical protein